MRPVVISAVFLAMAFGSASPTLALTNSSGAGASNSSGTAASTAATKTQAFKTEAEARSACGSQAVVWANTSSHVLHASGSKYFGKTKHGSYMCEATATHAGYHMARND